MRVKISFLFEMTAWTWYTNSDSYLLMK